MCARNNAHAHTNYAHACVVWWTQARLDADGAESALRVARATADTPGASAKAEADRPAEPMAAAGTTSGGDDDGSEGGDGDGENEEAEENEDGDADSNDGDGDSNDGDGDDGSDERADANDQQLTKRPTRASARHAARVSSNAALQQTLACCAACHCVRALRGGVCFALVVHGSWKAANGPR